ncbi:OsmC family protein [Streptomyces sp. ISL-11]|uniref:OsmC family protein n=1 Tax=Streptomyces sp. ISL-11 TaxID=2819174 RepID=UPI001BEB2598|nr:OsmC family protein [Streptomyces sp. ISL-11]MBT2385721.1 OsmC family protein [Streptomyces sp. ISL-11]
MTTLHTYETTVTWTGNQGSGTSGYRDFSRDHEVAAPGRPVVLGSSDPAFRGDASRWNPEQLLLAAISECHLLWYLHVCAVAGVVVTAYTDDARGTMRETADGGHFTEAVLRPRVEVEAADMTGKALALHDVAHRSCFIANSVNFPVRHEPVVTVRAA